MKYIFIILITTFTINISNAQGWEWLNPLPQGNNLNSVSFINVDTAYVVGSTGIILKTIDGGYTWTTQTSGTTNVLYSVYCINSNTGYAVGDNGIILKTSNGGTTWISHLFPVSFLLYAF